MDVYLLGTGRGLCSGPATLWLSYAHKVQGQPALLWQPWLNFRIGQDILLVHGLLAEGGVLAVLEPEVKLERTNRSVNFVDWTAICT